MIDACSKKETTTTNSCTDITPTYTNQIALIINTNCAYEGCHNASSKANGLDLSTANSIKTAMQSNNKVLGSINQTSGFSPMPKGLRPLPNDQIQQIYCWSKNNFP